VDLRCYFGARGGRKGEKTGEEGRVRSGEDIDKAEEIWKWRGKGRGRK